MLRLWWLACLWSLSVGLGAEVWFEETFNDEDWSKRWVTSSWKGGNGPAGKFDWTSGEWPADAESKGIRTGADMHYHSASALFKAPFSNKGKTLVVQYTVKNEKRDFSFCGGGYIKLLGSKFNQETFGGDTDYKIMFGPDLCGYDVARIHLIFSWRGKNLLKNEDIKLEYDDKNEFTHVYTLVVNPDSTYQVYFDLKEKSKGSLHDGWDFPNKTHDDPSDSKPADWVEEAKIDEPNAKKPADWVDDARIRDPTATKPDEWDDEEDGTYEAPMIDNPAYKGAWLASRIDNPAYKGPWVPRQVPNVDFEEDVYVHEDIGGVGFELWTVNSGSIFDNILVTDSFDHAKSVAEKVWKPFVEKEKEAKKAYDKKMGKDEPDAGPDDEDDGYDDVGADKVEL